MLLPTIFYCLLTGSISLDHLSGRSALREEMRILKVLLKVSLLFCVIFRTDLRSVIPHTQFRIRTVSGRSPKASTSESERDYLFARSHLSSHPKPFSARAEAHMLLLQALLERADDSPGCSPIYRDHRRSRMRGKIAYSQVERRSVEEPCFAASIQQSERRSYANIVSRHHKLACSLLDAAVFAFTSVTLSGFEMCWTSIATAHIAESCRKLQQLSDSTEYGQIIFREDAALP